ncbi:MAG: bifunctional folylpolyglutamate synthase/dihydrofolate synthase [Clostridia bacterium]|nr:bifunctional folylpolyglutamate synthase/dihydrofolate synthase [Clostridia bacterium]
MNYIEAVNYIHSLLKFGVRPGLTGMNALLHLLGEPHKGLRCVHVAGTNGKGSVSTAISNVLIEAGYNVGLYTSPYVSEFLERVQFNGCPVNKDVFAHNVENVKAAVEKLQQQDVIITEFEALTASAFLCFKELGCDLVVLEVGLGGRLDATNVIGRPLVNVITSLSLDHTAILGNTIEEIAFEKCGTLKENFNAVVSVGQPEGAMDVINNTARRLDGTVIIPAEENISIIKSDLFGTQFSYDSNDYFITMPGLHQVKNMTCVIEACEILKKDFEISYENIVSGIKNTVLPARVEVINKRPLVVLDGGHNEDGAKAFFAAVEGQLENKSKIIVVAGMMADKDVEVSLKPLMKETDLFIAVTPENPRAMNSEELREIAKRYSKEACSFESIRSAVDFALSVSDDDSAVFVVGSLYLAGEIRGYLKEKFTN